jgi:hypothetical protein
MPARRDSTMDSSLDSVHPNQMFNLLTPTGLAQLGKTSAVIYSNYQ